MLVNIAAGPEDQQGAPPRVEQRDGLLRSDFQHVKHMLVKRRDIFFCDRLCWSHSSTRAAWHKDVPQPMQSLYCNPDDYLSTPGQAAVTVYTSRKESNTSTCASSKQSLHQCRGLLACIDSTTKTHRNLSRAGKILKPFHTSWDVCLLINT